MTGACCLFTVEATRIWQAFHNGAVLASHTGCMYVCWYESSQRHLFS